MTSALRPRSIWHRLTLSIQAAWALVLVAVLALNAVLPDARWYMIHTAGLGLIGSAILVWTWHFADALTRRRQSQKAQLARLALMGAGAVQLGVAMAGVGRASEVLSLTGPTTIMAAMSWHLAALRKALSGGFLGRAAVTLRFHATGAAFLILGATFGMLLAVDATSVSMASLWRRVINLEHDSVALAHSMCMTLGFVGLTILGTLVTFGPTVARARMAPRAVELSTRALPLLAGSVLAGAIAAIVGMGRLSGVFVFAWMLASLLVLVPVAQSWRGSMLSVGDGWFMGAAMSWILAAAGTWGYQLVASGTRGASPVSNVRFGMMIGAGAVQMILGALTFLLPVVMGGGPARLRVTLERIEPSAAGRWFVINGGMLIAVLTPSDGVRRAVLVVVVLAAAASFALVAVFSLRQRADGGRASPDHPANSGASRRLGLAGGLSGVNLDRSEANGAGPGANGGQPEANGKDRQQGNSR
ncbi:MAG: hypothetical protein Q3979_00625 [Actinomycetaceae bacterium]|nr:hypothetical protein [Actinomycetaceae bacterium]